MLGAIAKRDILAHPIVTVRCFGWRVFFRAIAPWHDKTFLSLLQDMGCFGATAGVPTILERCVGLELRAKRIYAALANAFRHHETVGPFFAGLVQQEQYHADLLEICRAAALRTGSKANLFNPWQDYLPRLEQQMDAAEAAVREIDSLETALRMVVQIESSEINEVFTVALAATNAAFVKKLRPFRRAIKLHMTYILDRLPELSPELTLDCRELRARFPRVGGS